jgi:hypothetical protein
LGFLDVGSGKGFDFLVLQGGVGVLVVEAFGAGFSGCRYVFEYLELPICPTSEDGIGCFTDLRDFSGADVGIETCSKFSYYEWNSKQLRVLGSGVNSQFMEGRTLLSLVGSWFTSLADVATELTAISVIVQHMIG